MKKFQVSVLAIAEIELVDDAISAVDDEWRECFYPLNTPEDIAAHIGYNMIANHLSLSEMDGWADQPNENARIVGIEWSATAAKILLEIDMRTGRVLSES